MLVGRVAERAVRRTNVGLNTPSILTSVRSKASVKKHCGKNNYKLTLAEDGVTVLSPFPSVSIPAGEMTVSKFVMERCRWYTRMSDTALVDCHDDVSLSYADLWDMSEAFGSWLRSYGLQRGDAVLFCLHNCPEFAVCFHGCLGIGVIVSPCSHHHSPQELAGYLAQSQAKLIVTSMANLATAAEALKLSGVKCDAVTADLSELRRQPSHCHHHTVPGGEVRSLSECLKSGARSATDNDMLASSYIIDAQRDVAVLPFSSGTTGQPKAVALTHYNLIANICQQIDSPNRDIFDHRGNPDQETTIGVTPFCHIYGLTVLLGSVLAHGGKLVTMEKFKPALFLSMCEKHQVRQLHFVPPLTQFMAQDSRVDNYRLKAVQSIFCGAAPMGEDLSRLASRRLNGAIVRQGYGMTETSPLCTASPLTANRYGSVGVPVPNTAVRIVSVATGRPLAAGEAGEIRVKGPQVMRGYVREDGSIDPGVDADGFLPTGDVGCFDDGGYLYVVDRLKEMIKVKGFQVAPAELESLLIQHGDISDAAVIGVPHHQYGEAPRAFVVQVPNSSLTEDDVIEYIASHTARYKHLSGGVQFVESIPKTATGKILRRQLKAMV